MLKTIAIIVVATAVFVGIPYAAFAQPVMTYTDAYETRTYYKDETVRTCSKGDDKTTEGAIVGGLIGSQDGNAGLGALIGAIIGNEIGEEKCTTTTRKVPTHSEQVWVGYDIKVTVDNKTYTVKHRN